MLVPLLAALIAAPASKAFPFPTEVHTLPNGLRLVLVSYDSPGLVAYYTLMRVGSRNEVEKGRSGYAHFFEHMMFRGTKAHPAGEYDATISRLGMSANAFTSEDMTVYHLYGPAKALPTVIEYEADRFQNLDYDEPAFRTEAGAILGEYQKSASIPEQKLEEKMKETAYLRHTYAHTTIGYLQDIERMPSGYQYSREFFRRYYTPDNATVVIAGDFDKAASISMVEKAYGSWKGKLEAERIPAEPRQRQSKHAVVPWDKPTLPRLWITWHAPSSGDLRAAAVQNLLDAYLFGPTSPLYQNYVLGKQLVDSMEPSYNDHRDPYLFGVLLRVKDAKDLRTLERAVLKEVAALAGGRVDAGRMEAVRSNLKYANIMSLDTPDRAAVTLAVNMAQTGEVEFLNKEFAIIEELKPIDLSDFAKRYFLDVNRTTVTLVTAGAAR
ncbi:MAG: insulinase family protein [Deltaproteobacteria bacterium]|nr:MAG: insulinase family protein [Deltaproteobacteria bacterium]